jgi:hypothetical protein
MAITYSIDQPARILRTDVRDEVTNADVREYRERLARDPRFVPDLHHLVVATAVTSIKVSGEMIRSLAATDPFAKETKRAIVVSGDESYGLARMFQSLTVKKDNLTRLFLDVAEAEAWLQQTD